MRCVFLLIVVGVLLSSMVSASDCSIYFSKADNRRDRVVSDSTSLIISVGRLYSKVDEIYDQLGSMNGDDNISSLSGMLSDMDSRKKDIDRDFSDMTSAVGSYDTAIGDSRKDIPSSCVSVFNIYDTDLKRISDYQRAVKRYYDRFLTSYNKVNNYRNDLTGTTVSVARSAVDKLSDSVTDLSYEVDNGIDFSVNMTGVSGVLISEADCFDMIKVNSDKAVKDCVADYNDCLGKLEVSRECPVCDVKNCSELELELSDCVGRLNDAKDSSDFQCPSVPVCDTDSEKDSIIASLNMQISSLSGERDVLNGRLNDLQEKNSGIQKALNECESIVCEDTFIWKASTVGFIILIVLAWIIKM